MPDNKFQIDLDIPKSFQWLGKSVIFVLVASVDPHVPCEGIVRWGGGVRQAATWAHDNPAPDTSVDIIPRHESRTFRPVMTSAASRQATLVIPGLFGDLFLPVDGDPFLMTATRPAALARLLARADRRPGSMAGFDARLFDLFGVSLSADSDLPIAAVTRLADMGVADQEWWVRADPVYLEPRRSGLVLHTGLDLGMDEAERLVAELNEILVTDGWVLRAPHPNRWYLKPPAAASLTTTPLAAVVGMNVDPCLPKGPDAPVWHTRLNELQILLHTSAVNEARQKRGQLPANSVWFWGGGWLPSPGSTRYTKIWSNEPLGLGLARLASLATSAVPANAGQWLKQAGEPGEHLLILDELDTSIQRRDVHGWQTVMDKLNTDWIAPLVTAVQTGALAELTLMSDVGPVFQYRRAHRWRFWRRVPSPTELRGAS